MKALNMNLSDSTLAFLSGTATGTYVVQNPPDYTAVNPWIAQVVVPLLGAVIVPFLRDVSRIAAAWFKQRLESRRSRKK